MAKWKWECQTCQKARGCYGNGLCLPCLDDECKYEPFQNFATTSTKYDPSKLAYYTSNSAEEKKMKIKFKKSNTVISAECFPDKKRPALCITKGNEVRVYGYFHDKECADKFICALYQLIAEVIKE